MSRHHNSPSCYSVHGRGFVLMAALVFSAMVAACDGKRPDGSGAAAEPDAGGTSDTAAMADMPGMSGMPGMSAGNAAGSAALMTATETTFGALQGAGPDSLLRALPAVRQNVANLVASVNREMRDMNMSGDASWSALIDSLRTDLTRLPEIPADGLAEAMSAHGARVTRLIASHRSMMASMAK